LINATGYSAAGGRPDQADGKSTASAPAQRRDLADRGVILFIEFVTASRMRRNTHRLLVRSRQSDS